MFILSLLLSELASTPGAGAHLGRMTLDPGVTAFCLAASRPFETARDASIKDRETSRYPRWLDHETTTLDPFLPEDGVQLMTLTLTNV